ncbi:MAG: hypothetical protein IT190_07595 [Microbacteriaceae bacterium]|nr:hypothetical protein [Microbacteriaceae bacterium]
MACEVNKIDSNIVGLSYALEGCIGKLPDVVPDSGAEDGAVWYPLDPNEFSDFGGEVTTVARNPINASRQRKKGVVTDLEASGGFSQDVTQSGLPRLMQGFCFADARERVSTKPINGKAASTITVTNVSSVGPVINVGAGLGVKFKAGDILKLSGMVNSANNRSDIVVVSIATDALTVSGTLVTETATSATRLEIIGYQFASGIAGIVFGAGEALTLTRSTGSFITDGYNVGEWIFVGGDAVGTKFATNVQGFARIQAVAALSLTLKEPTWVPLTDTGATKTIQVYLGTFIRNENTTALIKRRSYQLERTLGQDDVGIQSEYLVGAVPNELTLNVKSADKITADLSFTAIDNVLRDGTTGLKTGTRTATIPVEDAYNSSNDVYQLRLFITDPLKVTPKSLYAKVMEAKVMLKNNASGLKAIGTLGSFDINVGDFEVDGDLQVYFTTIAAVQAVKNNSDVGFNLICSKDNAGFVYDIPLLSLGGGRVEVAKDEPIKLPLKTSGAENSLGFTLGVTYFGYLPNVAMATP